MFSAGISHAQNLTLKVWPDGVPGAKENSKYVEKDVGEWGPRIAYVKDPELLVYLPEKDKATGTAVVICPGGGYGRLAIDHEGYNIAKWLNTYGIAGIVLKYRLPSDEIMKDKTIGPLQDVQEAIRIVRRKANAGEWNIQSDKIGVMGFSAGGHLAGTASTMYNEVVYKPEDATSARPDFSVIVYGVLSMQSDITHEGSQHNLLGDHPDQKTIDRFSNEKQVDEQTPPTFLVHATDDGGVPVENTLFYYEALHKHKVSVEMHIYQHGGHGFGLAQEGGTESTWPAACILWLKESGWTK